MQPRFVIEAEQDGVRYTMRGYVLAKGTHAGIDYPSDHLLITYTLENKSQAEVCIFNRGHTNAQSTLGYVERRPDGVIELSQKAFAAPPDCPPTYVPILPRVSVLKPGAVMTEDVYFALPFKTHTPFDFCLDEAERAKTVDGARIEFRLGYQLAGGKRTVRENDTFPPEAAQEQHFWSSGVQSAHWSDASDL
ncbi:hypothetical protein J8C06_05660 [Chloracidobacterium validum]|uniref:Uncharacterized protein n=1 Tax=Chloracidobacterium validum TaxID=2821543 RepID=A0ABX8B4G9_9BACT|nr:hypothetical protein [Chloracidobacterium validum]QUW01868.1 hypothetical protein J8C06_05660 [Chloracidobacterium validum]